MKKIIVLLAFMVILLSTASAQVTKKFKWIAWKAVSAKTKAELKKIKYIKDETVYDHIIEYMEEGCEAEVCVLDMDGDGKMEYAVTLAGRYCCGSAGCSLSVYSLGGAKQLHLTDYLEDVKPAKNGVISSKGFLIKFQTVK